MLFLNLAWRRESVLGMLASRCRQEGLFEQLRRAARNAEGLAVWPPDACQHGENSMCSGDDLVSCPQNTVIFFSCS